MKRKLSTKKGMVLFLSLLIFSMIVTPLILLRLFGFDEESDYNKYDDIHVVYETSTSIRSTMHTTQRKSFFAAGRIWLFFPTSPDRYVYTSSVDGVTWDEPTLIDTGGAVTVYAGYLMAIHYNGSHVSMVRRGRDGTYYLKYRLGVPQSNGTIGWVTTEQTIFSWVFDGGITFDNYFVALDSSNMAYVSYMNRSWTDTGPIWVIKSSTNDGTWTNATGYPIQLSSFNTTKYGDQYFAGNALISLGSNEMYALYSDPKNSVDYVYGRIYNGTDWESEHQVTTRFHPSLSWFSAVGDGTGNVYLLSPGRYTLENASDYRWFFRAYDGSSWADEVALTPAGINTNEASGVLTLDNSSDVLCAFYTDLHIPPLPNKSPSWKLYCQTYDMTTWSPMVRFVHQLTAPDWPIPTGPEYVPANTKSICLWSDYDRTIQCVRQPFYNTTELKDLNDALHADGKPYIASCSTLITHLSNATTTLTFNVSASIGLTSVTEVNPQNRYTPDLYKITGADNWFWNGLSGVLQVRVVHSSEEVAVVYWY